ncbi:MAG: DUF1822 family protein [Cyanobacteria bacterium J06592_8]
MLTIPITSRERRLAEQFKMQHAQPELTEQVYRNTLAVWAVNYYCQCLEIPTNLEGSDSWDSVMQSLSDVADLNLPGIGQLECRPVESGATTVEIPAEVWGDRIAYIIVELNPFYTEAKLLGFLPSTSTGKVPLSLLQPLENLPDVLAPPQPQIITDLSDWLHHQFEESWQAIDSFIKDTQIAYAVRTKYAYRTVPESSSGGKPAVERIKLLGAEIEQAGKPLAMLVEVKPTSISEVDIGIEVSPTQVSESPQNLHVMILDETGDVLMEAQAKSTEEIKLEFSGEKGDRFSVQLVWDDLCLTEQFAI